MEMKCLATAVPDQSDRVQCGDDVCLTIAVSDHASRAQCGDDVCLATAVPDQSDRVQCCLLYTSDAADE